MTIISFVTKGYKKISTVVVFKFREGIYRSRAELLPLVRWSHYDQAGRGTEITDPSSVEAFTSSEYVAFVNCMAVWDPCIAGPLF
jgi:hypothetical protein